MKTLLSPIAVEICRVPVRPVQHPQDCLECQKRLNIALLFLETLGDRIRRDGGKRRGRKSANNVRQGKCEGVVEQSH